MSENRKCVNCRHRIIGKNCSSKCEIDGHYISYGECFLGWCRHWAKQKDGKEAKYIVLDEFSRMKMTAQKGKEQSWTRNLEMLVLGAFGIDTKSPKTLLAYWKAQALAGYPSADENVRYFEEMVRKESGK